MAKDFHRNVPAFARCPEIRLSKTWGWGWGKKPLFSEADRNWRAERHEKSWVGVHTVLSQQLQQEEQKTKGKPQ